MPSEMEESPALSVILPAPDRLDTLLRTVRAIAAQDIATRIELVIVARHPAAGVPAEAAAPLRWVQVVPMPEWTTMTAARVRGVLRARAPIVALAEDHCFPSPGWARALLAAHHGPWAAVGPAFLNANPASILSWANLAIEYGPWLSPVVAGAVDHVPGHNSSYKRDVLLAYGERLEEMLEAESILHWDLRQRGSAVAMAPAATTRHENFSRLTPSFALRFGGGRLFAASRAAGWSWWRRAAYAVASPAIPIVRARRTYRHLRRVPDAHGRAGLRPLIFFLLAVDAIGECAGYLFGLGDQPRRLSEIEYDRPRFLNASDRRAIQP